MLGLTWTSPAGDQAAAVLAAAASPAALRRPGVSSRARLTGVIDNVKHIAAAAGIEPGPR